MLDGTAAFPAHTHRVNSPIAQLVRFRSRLTKLIAQGHHHHRCCKLRVFGAVKLGSRAFVS
jgi:hypothetical protein